ncbi:uncharacterized protein LOC118265582 [Spodoptera frugiperda]|uniref:Uncharacterized protein LOC118265582 n=1 Tax=Spodoptera frugiperda TaxID=7108 RepID=A0A9R0E393_SPOFR|nr:uncharacterized protein LOC118265582 [Spodoptera frugiperda]XP_050557905.1 uncharacterized protein LOC118265582 [Spodoptera frugiperda]
MGKRKRSDKDDSEMVEKLYKKVKKLVKNRRRISSSTSDDEPMPPLSPAQSSHFDIITDLEPRDEIPTIEMQPESDELVEENQDLEPDILQLLGSDPTQNKSFGDNLHKDLVTRWKHILTNGLSKDEKTDILKQYLPAENCTNMKAPALNPEIKSALSDNNIKRDAYSEQKQNQMSSCISAIGKALNLVLSQKENVPQDLIKTLSDAGRLLCDTHYRESLSRRFAIVNSLSKQKREIIKNTKIDDHLFGSNLSEHLKSSKAISVSASELRFSTNTAKFNQSHRGQPNTSTSRYPAALNARGAPRAPAAEPRVYPSQNRRQLPPPSAPRDHRRVPTTTTTRPRINYPQQSRRR